MCFVFFSKYWASVWRNSRLSWVQIQQGPEEQVKAEGNQLDPVSRLLLLHPEKPRKPGKTRKAWGLTGDFR